MGCFKPEPGEFVRIGLELEGRPELTQEKYEDFKREVKQLAKKHGAKMRQGEHVKIEKAPRKKSGKNV